MMALRTEHLDDLHESLLQHGGKEGPTLARKTVHEVHLIVRNALDLAVRRRLVDHDVALAAHSTLLSIAGGLLAATEGRVVGDKDVSRLDPRQLTKFRQSEVGFVFQRVNSR
jgi:predicted ABC-type transport system involved in lysophospholipase L1 biosynthesis ATPase subunit